MRHTSTTLSIAIGAALLSLPIANSLAAEISLPAVSVGAGVRTSFLHKEVDSAIAITPAAGAATELDDFELNSARIYLSGKVTENISIMFNTEYNGTSESVGILDAVAQFSFSDQFNVWAGRFIAPSDRANLYGPYYSSHWGVYQDGIQDGYPSETIQGMPSGRDDGVMYWGQFGIAKVSFGVFDVAGLTKGNTDVMAAGRVQLDFWDAEGGYYLNGTYYGDKDLLAVGVAGEKTGSDLGYSADFLLEKKLGGAGVVTVEAQYAKYEAPSFGYPSPSGNAGYTSSKGAYVLGAYLFPMEVGIGKFQVLAKVAQAEFNYTAADVDQDTTEVNFNYIIKQFNARISAFYIDTDFSPSSTLLVPVSRDSKQYGIGLQVQM